MEQLAAKLDRSARESSAAVQELKATVEEREATVASLKAVVLEKEEDWKSSGGGARPGQECGEKVQGIPGARQERDAQGGGTAGPSQDTLAAKEDELKELKAKMVQQKSVAAPSKRAAERRAATTAVPTPRGSSSRAAKPTTATAVNSDFDPSPESADEDNDAGAGAARPTQVAASAAGDNFKFFRSKNKRSLEDDYDAFVKKAANPKNYPPKKKARPFFSLKGRI